MVETSSKGLVMDTRVNDGKPRLVIGCNYHTTWQSRRDMRFILVRVEGERALLGTRGGSANFWTKVKDLIFIETKYNREKANEPLAQRLKYLRFCKGER